MYAVLHFTAWFIVTMILTFATLRASLAMFSVFFTLDLTFMLLFAHYFTENAHLGTAGGALGIACSMCAFYTAASGLYTPDTTVFILPAGDLSRKD